MPGDLKRHVARAIAWTGFGLLAGPEVARAQAAEFTPPVPYLSSADSPFLDSDGWAGRRCHLLEDFQTGTVAVPGLSFQSRSGTRVVGSGGIADAGPVRYALSGTTSGGIIQLDFSAEILGDLPERVGFVWTRGFNGSITLTAVDGAGRVSRREHRMSTPNLAGNPADDLFFGVTDEGGIASLTISFNPPVLCEIDHVQFSRPEIDGDRDGTPDCLDGCPEDPTNLCRRRGDLDGDGVPDVVVQNPARRAVATWLLAPDGAIRSVENIMTAGAGYAPVAAADFGGDGILELVLQNATARQLVAWTLGGPRGITPIRGEPIVGPDGRNFAPAVNLLVHGSIDADADGQVDLIARDMATGLLHLWKMSGTRVVATSTLPAVPSNPAWNIAGILDGPQPGSWLVVGHNRVNRRVIVWTIEGASLASAVTITGASGLPVQTPVGSTVPAVRRFADDESFSLLVRSSAGRVDRWRIDPAGRYLRGSAVTATNQPSMMLRPD